MTDSKWPPSRRFPLMMAAIFFCYLAMVMPLSSLTLHVSQVFAMSNFAAGVIAGAAFVATIFLRKRGGDLADLLGGRRCFLRGCLWYSCGGLVCLAAAWCGASPEVSFFALACGRVVVGVGESLTNVGMAHWSVGVMGVARSGRVLATTGMAMYGAVVVGGPLGAFLYRRASLGGVMLACVASSLTAWAIAAALPVFLPHARAVAKPSLWQVLERIRRFGTPACFCAAGFAVLSAFIVKTYTEQGWPHASWGFTALGLGFVSMRLFIGHLPDRHGGLRVALGCAALELVGLIVLCGLWGMWSATLGCFLTGAGLSMLFPSLGLEIVRSAPPEMRGAAMSCYNIFIDFSYGLAGPFAGFLGDNLGARAPYVFTALSVTVGLAMLSAAVRRSAS